MMTPYYPNDRGDELDAAGRRRSPLQGLDDYVTPEVEERTIGSGYDNYSTPGINEGPIGSGYDDYSTPSVDEGA